MAEGIDPVSLEEQRKQAVDRLFTEEVADEDQRKAFRQQSWDLTQPPPDQAGEALQLGNKFGVPRKAVEADPEYWKRRDQEARRKLLMEASPRTMAWLDDEDNYAVAKDDVDILSQIESTFSKIGYAAKGGFQRFAAVGVAGERQAMGETMEFYRRRDEWEAREERRKKLGQDAPRGWRSVRVPDVGTISGFDLPVFYGNLDAAPAASGIVREEVRKALPESMRPMFASQVGIDDAKAVRGVLERRMDMVDARARAKFEEFTETLEKARSDDFVLNAFTQAVTSVTEMAPSLATFAVMRGRGGATAASIGMGAQVAGAEYLEGIYNLNLSERDASDRALLQAGVEVVTERISLGFLDEMISSNRSFLGKLLPSMGVEQVQEQAATLGNRLVDIPYTNPDMTIGEFLAETPESMANTAMVTLFASGITNTTLIGLDTAVRDMVERSVLSQPSAGDAAIDAVLKKAKESRLGKRSPEKLKDVLDRQAAGTGVETVTVDLDELAQALKEKGVELSDALDGLGVPRDVLQQKWENFGEIEVKLSDLATSDLMRLYGAETQAHTRRNDDPYTPARKEKMREALEPEMQETAKRIYDDLQNGADMAEKEQQVAERVRSRIRGAGILAVREQENASVAIQTAMVTTLARRVGADPVEFYDQHYPRIQGSIDGMVAEEGALEQAKEGDVIDVPLGALTRSAAGESIVRSNVGFDDAKIAAMQPRSGDAPVKVMRLPDGRLYLADGNHRFMKARASGATTIKAEIIPYNPLGALEWDMSQQDGLIPADDALAQLIGPKATSANKAILDTAKKMAKEKVKGPNGKKGPKYTRQQIWDKTAEMGQPWYQDDNGDWISEIEDGVVVVKDRKGKLSEVVEFPSIYAEYPQLGRMSADARSRETVRTNEGKLEPDGVGGWYDPTAIFGVKMRIVERGDRGAYTATHEIQHAVDDIERRTMGGKRDEYAKKPTERRAFNTMYRRLWTMEERIATPPWKTEQEAVDWWIGGRLNDAPAAQFNKEGTFDPQPGPERPAPPQMPERGQNAEFADDATGLVQGEVDAVEEFDEQRQRTVTRIQEIGKSKEFEKLLGRTFLSVKSIATAMANNPRLRTVILKKTPEPLGETEAAEFNKTVSAEIRELTKLATRLRAQVEDVVSWKAMFGVAGSVDEGQIYTLLADIETPVVTASIGRKRIAQLIRQHVQTRLPDWMGREATETKDVAQAVSADIRKGIKGRINNEDAVQAFRSLGVQPDKMPKRPAKISPAEVKKVEAALETSLMDLDAPMSAQRPEHYQAIRDLWDAETERLGMFEEEDGTMVPDYVDFWGSDYWLLGVNGSRPLDDRPAREVLELLAGRSKDESGGVWMEGLIEKMRNAGVVGGRYVPGGVRPAEQDGPPQTQSIVIFDERAPVLLTDPSGNLMQQRRGQFSPSQNVITMFEAADVTTLMHEGAHWYLAEIERMASAEGAHPFVTEQWEAVKKWGKVGPDFRMYDDMGRVTPEGRELQEAFAETFEVYLQTGKAPVPSLREAFRAFKQWITALWRDIRTGKIRLPERANLSPEITRVMDRMLAVDEEIESQTAEVVTKAEAMANDLYERGIITKRQRDAAIMNMDEAREAAKEDLMAQIMQAELRVREAQMSAEQRRIKGDVTREYDRSAVGRAVSWLGYGQWKGDVPVSETEGRDSEVEFYQSIRTATRMPMEDIHAWVVNNVDSKIQEFSSGDEGAMMSWRLSDAPDAPRVLLSIRLNRKGRADVNLFLDNKMADALDEISDPVERSRIAMEMFSQAVMVMRQYSAETPDLKAFNFIAAENEKAGRKAKSREELYRFMLSTMRMDGYTAYEIGSQTSVVRQADGVKSADPLFDGAGFVMIRDGVDVDEFARNEILRGSQSGGDAGEVVTALTAVRLSRAPRGGVDRGRLEAGRADPGGAVDDTLGQSLPGFYSALGRFIASSNTARAPAAQWKGMIQNAPGVKAEEVEWSGVLDWLDASEGPVTREALAAFVEANGVRVEEVVRGGGSEAQRTDLELQRDLLPKIEERDQLSAELDDLHNEWNDLDKDGRARYSELEDLISALDEEIEALQDMLRGTRTEDDTKWSSYTLPGGENYREMLLTLPRSATQNDERLAEINRQMDAYDMSQGMEGFNRLASERDRLRDDRPDFRSSHWSEPNVLAHVRFKERTGPNGERVLALEEVQSDWHQAGREQGYKRKLTDAEIAERDALVAEREDIRRNKITDDALRRDNEIVARIREMNLPTRVAVPNAPFKNNAWANLVLKRMIRYAAENGFDAVAWIPGNVQNGQIVEDTGDNRGDFYDKIVPNLASKLGKKYGARVGSLDLGVREAGLAAENQGSAGWQVWRGEEPVTDAGMTEAEARAYVSRETLAFHSLPITPELAAAAMTEGFPLFQRGDPKGWGETAPPPDLPPMRLDLEAVRELYGQDAVRRLPKPIRDRSRDKTSIDGMMDIIRASAKTLKRKPPPTLFQYIRSRKARTVAGQTVPIKKWGIKGAADELKAMNREDLINETNGIHIDYVRESVAEAGYLPEDATVNDFLNAIDREARGEPVYSRFDQKEIEDQRFAKEWADWLDSQGVDIFETDMKKLKAQVAKVVTSTAADAVTPDQAAEMLGFPTGEDLLNVLSMMGNRDQWVREETDRRLREEFGDPMADGTFEEEARVIAEAEVMSRAAEIEMEALARAVGEPAASKLAKEMAMDSLGLMTVKELEGWERFLNAERREMNNTLEAVKRGDMVQAFIHKRRQLVNMHLARAAREKSQAIEKTRKDLLTYYSSKGRRDKIAPDYLEKIEALLEGYELRVSKQGPGEQKRRMSAKEYVDDMDAQGREDQVAPEARLLAELSDKKVWRTLTADEVDYVAGTVRNIAHLGRTKDKLLRAQEKRRFQAVIGALVDRMNETGKLPGALGVFKEPTRQRSPTRTMTETLVDAMREGHSWLMRPEHQARSLDGGELGPVWEALFRPMAEAADVETQMMREATRLYREAWSKFSSAERNAMSKRTVSVPELPAIGKRFTQLDLISIALNWGVTYNREVLLEGYGWTADQVEAALFRTMTDKHWDLVESLWAISGMYKAEAFALEKAMTGVEPKAVEGISFTLPSGRKIEGKYYHIQYDASQPGKMSRRQAKDNDAEALTAHRKSRSKAMTKNGGLIERRGSGGRKVKLGLSVFEKAMSETIHDIAFRRAVFDVGRIIADDNFADTYQEVAGMEAYRQLNVWLKDIAMPPMEVLDPIVKAFAHVRRNIPLAVMGYKVGTALIQPTGLLAAMPLVGHRRVLFAVAKAFANPRGSMYATWKQVADMSEFMRDRVAGYERDVRETTTAMTKGGGLDFIRRNAFVFITGIDIAVSVPTWMAAYGKAMDGKVKGIQAGVEEDAIAYADSIIRRTQTAGKTQDLSRFQRGGEFQKQISMIFGYFNNLYSLSAQQTLDMRRGNISRAEWAWHMSILFVAIPLLAEVFAGRLFPDDEDDEETIEGKIAETVLLNFTGMFPGLRDAVALNVKPEFGYRLSPTSKFIEDIGRTAGLPAQLLLDEERELKEADVRRAVNAVGALTGLPSAQINITGNYIIDALEGEEDPTEDPVDAAREALVRNTR